MKNGPISGKTCNLVEFSDIYLTVSLEPSQIYKIELFTKIVNGFQLLTILAKSSIFEV